MINKQNATSKIEQSITHKIPYDNINFLKKK